MRRGYGMKPPGSAGVPPAQVLAQPRLSAPPGSTGNDARILLRPSPCGSRRQGGRVPHRGETERHPTLVHAGGTPALPGGHPPVTLGGRSPSFVDNFHPPPSTLHPPPFKLQTSNFIQRWCMRAGRPRSRVGILLSRLVAVRRPSWITLFLLFQESGAGSAVAPGQALCRK